jgi:hypothetical protein
VAGQRYDLIVSNPPFAISPDTSPQRLLYRDGGLPGDGLCERIAREASAHLTEGGICQFLCNWECRRGEDPKARLATWFAQTGCDAWVLVEGVTEAAEYAATWIRQTERDEPGRRQALHDRWMAEFRRRGVEAIGSGVVTMRRRATGTPWYAYEEAPAEVGPCGAALWRGLLLRDYVREHDDEALLSAPLRVAPELRLVRTSVPGSEDFLPETDEAYLSHGLSYRVQVGSPVLTLLSECRGTRPVRMIVLEMARKIRQPAWALLGPCVEVVREMVEQGLLLPPEIS